MTTGAAHRAAPSLPLSTDRHLNGNVRVGMLPGKRQLNPIDCPVVALVIPRYPLFMVPVIRGSNSVRKYLEPCHQHSVPSVTSSGSGTPKLQRNPVATRAKEAADDTSR